MGADGPAQFPARAQSLRILCIDGGGIKGYTALLILRRIFRTLSADMGGNLSPRPCDIFDLIAGTSTGGIIAVMLGRLHMTIDECIEVYERLGKDVFGRPVGGQVGRVLRGMTSSPFYDIADLQQSIRSVLRARGIESDEPFIEREGPGCKVYVFIGLHQSNSTHRGMVIARHTNHWQDLVCNPGRNRQGRRPPQLQIRPSHGRELLLSNMGGCKCHRCRSHVLQERQVCVWRGALV